MSQSPQSTPGPLARLRERRRARRQERLERRYFQHERCSLDVDTANRTARASAYGIEGGAVLSGFDGGGDGGGS